MSRDSSVGITTGYGLDGRGSIPGRVKMFLFYIVSRPALRPTLSPIQWIPPVLSPGVKRPGREADHSPQSSSEVKNGGAISPLPHTSSWPIFKIHLYIIHNYIYTNNYVTKFL
jgi:hypothetical protein